MRLTGAMTSATAPRLMTLVLMTASTTLSLNMFLPSLPAMGRDFGVSYDVIGLSIGGYLAVTAAISLILGPVSDRLGRRPVILGVYVIFVVASLGCAVAQNVTVFLACRLAQGVMVGGYIITLAVVRDTHETKAAAGLLGYIASAMAIAPLLGPMVGGVIDATFGWRANFVLYAAIGAVGLVVCLWDLKETVRPQRPNPEASRALLAEPLFWAFAGSTALSTGVFYAFLTGTPLVAEGYLGLSTQAIGIGLGSVTLGYMTGSFLAGRIAPRFSLTTMMLAGRSATLAGLSVGLIVVTLTEPSALILFGATIFVGFGNGLTMPSSNAGAMSLRPELAGTAAGLSGALTVGLGALLTTGVGAALPLWPAPAGLLTILLVVAAASMGAATAAHLLAARDARFTKTIH